MRHERQPGLVVVLFLWVLPKHLDIIQAQGMAGAPLTPGPVLPARAGSCQAELGVTRLELP